MEERNPIRNLYSAMQPKEKRAKLEAASEEKTPPEASLAVENVELLQIEIKRLEEEVRSLQSKVESQASELEHYKAQLGLAPITSKSEAPQSEAPSLSSFFSS